MGLTATQVAQIKKRWQRFEVEFVAFPAISWAGPTWPIYPTTVDFYPFCLLAPRYAYTAGPAVTIDGSDSYVRGGYAADVEFTKLSGTGVVTDNTDNTCTVSGADGLVVVEAVASYDGLETTGYAFVYGGSTGNMRAILSEISNLSGDFDNGEWKADLVLRGDYSGVLTNDGRDQAILMHSVHYWDGTPSTFGGYKRDENTFVLLCREAELHCKHSGEYETILHCETPAYALKNVGMVDQISFNEDGSYYTWDVSDLTPMDVAYFLMYYSSSLHQYFDVSLWNASSVIPNYIVHQDANIWSAIRDLASYNFGVVYCDRWGSVVAKPDPRIRWTDWSAIASEVYNAGNPLTTAHMLDYRLIRRRVDQYQGAVGQGVRPDYSHVEAVGGGGPGTNVGAVKRMQGMVVEDSTELASWLSAWIAHQNREYDLNFIMGMGHELNPGDALWIDTIAPPIGDSFLSENPWTLTKANYQFDFQRGFWTRNLYAESLNIQEE